MEQKFSEDINSFASKVDKLKVNGEKKLYKGKQRIKYTTIEGSNVAVSGLFFTVSGKI